MNKSPAFPLYAGDFLSDIKVILMSMDERGTYITLLCHHWIENGLPKNEKELQRLCHHPDNWSKIWNKVGKCFYEKDGKLFNKRLQKEKKKQREWRRKSRIGGIKSGETRRKMAEAKTNHPSNIDEPKTNTSFSSSSSSSPPDIKKEETIIQKDNVNEIDVHLTQLLITLMQKNDPKSSIIRDLTEKRQRNWINDCRLLRERDKRSPEDIKRVIEFSQSDDFWKSNILSMSKLRKQFGQLWIKSKPKQSLQEKIDAWAKKEE